MRVTADVGQLHRHRRVIEMLFTPESDPNYIASALNLPVFPVTLTPLGKRIFKTTLEAGTHRHDAFRVRCLGSTIVFRRAESEPQHSPTESDEVILMIPTPAALGASSLKLWRCPDFSTSLVNALLRSCPCADPQQVRALVDCVVAAGALNRQPLTILRGECGSGKSFVGRELLRSIAAAVANASTHITCRYISLSELIASNAPDAETEAGSAWIADTLMASLRLATHAIPFVTTGPWECSTDDGPRSRWAALPSPDCRPSTAACIVIDAAELLLLPKTLPLRLALARFRSWLVALTEGTLSEAPPVAVVALEATDGPAALSSLATAAFCAGFVSLGGIADPTRREKIIGQALISDVCGGDAQKNDRRDQRLVQACLAASRADDTASQLIHRAQRFAAAAADGAACVEKSTTLHVIPPRRLEDLFGLDDVIRVLRRLLLEPLRAGSLTALEGLGIHVPKGALIIGPSGTGKTALLAGLASSFRSSRVQGDASDRSAVCTLLVDAHTLICKEVGESEKNVAKLFRRARDAAPCVLFIDGIEAIAAPRGRERTEVDQASDRMLSALLVEMDGVVQRSLSATVVVVASAPSVDLLDPAVRRTGRLDLILSTTPLSARVASQMLQAAFTRSVVWDAESACALATHCDAIAESRVNRCSSWTAHAQVTGYVREMVALAAVRLGKSMNNKKIRDCDIVRAILDVVRDLPK